MVTRSGPDDVVARSDAVGVRQPLRHRDLQLAGDLRHVLSVVRTLSLFNTRRRSDALSKGEGRYTARVSRFEPIFDPLNRTGVRYVVVGGRATVLHGFARLTADVDPIVDLSPLEEKK